MVSDRVRKQYGNGQHQQGKIKAPNNEGRQCQKGSERVRAGEQASPEHRMGINIESRKVLKTGSVPTYLAYMYENVLKLTGTNIQPT